MHLLEKTLLDLDWARDDRERVGGRTIRTHGRMATRVIWVYTISSFAQRSKVGRVNRVA